MKTKQRTARVLHNLAVASAVFIAIAVAAGAQVQTQTKVTSGPSTKSIKIERGTVVHVSGNDVVIKAEDGTLRDFDNVPESTTVTVNGQQLNVHQLKPGMQVERQTITTTTPRMITTVKTVTGTVWYVSPPNRVILTLENGKNQSFKIPKGQKFMVNGQETDAFGLRKGMIVNAQAVTETPEVFVTNKVTRTGVMPPPPMPAPAPPSPDLPLLVIFVPARPASAPAETVAENLPKTGSNFPLIGLLGMLSVTLGLGLKAARTRKA